MFTAFRQHLRSHEIVAGLVISFLLIAFWMSAALGIFSLSLGQALAAPPATVKICHIPPGNPGNAHTITVGEAAVAAHIANHGDYLGPCAGGSSSSSSSSSSVAPHCGDGSVNQLNEQCDDGNAVSGDGCSNQCVLEQCGDGITQPGIGEECDDGNAIELDGCSDFCEQEKATVCHVPPGNPDAAHTIHVGASAVSAHLAHGDSIGACGPICGNATVEAGEQCDDGNHVNGDSCDSVCRNEVCGNGIQQSGEQCDDGNQINGDGCDNSCDVEFCGNSIVQAGEDCDDGNFVNGDGCDATCHDEVCGNGIVQTDEACDDGNSNNNDACMNDCTAAACGDGVVEAGVEDCDDGNTADLDGCSDICEEEKAVICHVPPGNPLHAHTISVGASAVAAHLAHGDSLGACGPICGNGAVEAGEQCDDDNVSNNDGCSSTCDNEICGDGITQSNETCDEGGLNGTPNHCDAECSGTTSSVCGNDALEAGEQCDDGNVTNGDGCDATCTNEVCGNGIQQSGEQCDDGNVANNDGCSSTCNDEICGDGIKQASEFCDEGGLNGTPNHCNLSCAGTTASLCGNDVLEAGEECDDGNVTDLDGCSSICEEENAVICHVPPGNPDAAHTLHVGASAVSAHLAHGDSLGACGPICGNGNLEGSEQCDDHNHVNGDGCDATCHDEICGNGIEQSNEECDDGNQVNDDSCTNTCHSPLCGDGIKQANEFCDEAGLNGTPNHCNDQCSGITSSVCGNDILESGEECDDGNLTELDGCSDVCEVENTVICHVPPGNPDEAHTLHVGVSAVPAHLAHGDNLGACGPICGNGVLQGSEQCDDHNHVNGDGCDATCHNEVCGNGIQQSGEQCDDGNQVNTDGCTNNCHLPICGDSITQAGEFCDDGGLNGTPNHCNLSCAGTTAALCGNDVVEAGEQCDDGNVANNDGCSSICHNEVCGDGVMQSNEQCDDGNHVNGDSCDSTCHTEVCGNGIQQSGEQCDDGDLVSGDGCDSSCHTEICGNGVLQGNEQCDDNNHVNGDGCDSSCRIEVCGDSVIEGNEECDDGNTDDEDGCSAICEIQNVTLCHIPPGNPGNAHTIHVGASAVPAHIAQHGDHLGPCEGDEVGGVKKGKKVICHAPPGNPGNAHTISIGAPAVNAHLGHHDEDELGPCEEEGSSSSAVSSSPASSSSSSAVSSSVSSSSSSSSPASSSSSSSVSSVSSSSSSSSTPSSSSSSSSSISSSSSSVPSSSSSSSSSVSSSESSSSSSSSEVSSSSSSSSSVESSSSSSSSDTSSSVSSSSSSSSSSSAVTSSSSSSSSEDEDDQGENQAAILPDGGSSSSSGASSSTGNSGSEGGSLPEDAQNSGHRGHRTNEIHAKADFLTSFYNDSDSALVAAGSFGGSLETPPTDEEVHDYLCSIQDVLPPGAGSNIIHWLAKYVSDSTGLDENMVFDQLSDPDLCASAESSSEGTAPVQTGLLPFPVDSDGVPVSTLPEWNECIRGERTEGCNRWVGRNNDWLHPDLTPGTRFTYKPGVTSYLKIPDGYFISHVDSNTASK